MKAKQPEADAAPGSENHGTEDNVTNCLHSALIILPLLHGQNVRLSVSSDILCLQTTLIVTDVEFINV